MVSVRVDPTGRGTWNGVGLGVLLPGSVDKTNWRGKVGDAAARVRHLLQVQPGANEDSRFNASAMMLVLGAEGLAHHSHAEYYASQGAWEPATGLTYSEEFSLRATKTAPGRAVVKHCDKVVLPTGRGRGRGRGGRGGAGGGGGGDDGGGGGAGGGAGGSAAGGRGRGVAPY